VGMQWLAGNPQQCAKAGGQPGHDAPYATAYANPGRSVRRGGSV